MKRKNRDTPGRSSSDYRRVQAPKLKWKVILNRRNGYFDKTIKTSMGETEIEVPCDRQVSFESIILPKHKRDVSDIEKKVLAMYARGMSQRDICATIDDRFQVPSKRDYETKECAVYNGRKSRRTQR